MCLMGCLLLLVLDVSPEPVLPITTELHLIILQEVRGVCDHRLTFYPREPKTGEWLDEP